MSNRMTLQEIVRGNYGRKIAYTNVEKITPENIVSVIGKCIGVFNANKTVIEYLWNYYKGDQPIRYRKKVVRDDIVNKVVENHAYEIVQFKVGQTYGECWIRQKYLIGSLNTKSTTKKSMPCPSPQKSGVRFWH